MKKKIKRKVMKIAKTNNGNSSSADTILSSDDAANTISPINIQTLRKRDGPVPLPDGVLCLTRKLHLKHLALAHRKA